MENKKERNPILKKRKRKKGNSENGLRPKHSFSVLVHRRNRVCRSSPSSIPRFKKVLLYAYILPLYTHFLPLFFRYASFKKLPLYVYLSVYFGWYISMMIILLLPIDITSVNKHYSKSKPKSQNSHSHSMCIFLYSRHLWTA